MDLTFKCRYKNKDLALKCRYKDKDLAFKCRYKNKDLALKCSYKNKNDIEHLFIYKKTFYFIYSYVYRMHILKE